MSSHYKGEYKPWAQTHAWKQSNYWVEERRHECIHKEKMMHKTIHIILYNFGSGVFKITYQIELLVWAAVICAVLRMRRSISTQVLSYNTMWPCHCSDNREESVQLAELKQTKDVHHSMHGWGMHHTKHCQAVSWSNHTIMGHSLTRIM